MKNRVACLGGILFLVWAQAGSAGVFADDLGKCLVNQTTEADRTDLVRWLFTAMASHPDVKSIATVSEEQRIEATKKTAKLFERLLSESCSAEFKAAVKNEGQAAITTGFQVLGNVAGMALMQHPDVTRATAELGSHIDNAKVEAALKSEP